VGARHAGAILPPSARGRQGATASVRFVIKRSFRFGLLVGLLGGLALALLKAFSGRGEEPAPAASAAGPGPARGTPWPRLEADPAVPAAPRLGLVPDPDAPAAPVPDPARVTGPVAMAPATEQPAPASAPEVPDAPQAGEASTTSKVPKTKAPTTKTPRSGKAASSTAKAAKASKKATRKKPAPARAWVEPDGGVCPTSHPVKAKLSSMIFHVPGGLSYDRTRPDRCYRDEDTAEADGLRPAKR